MVPSVEIFDPRLGSWMSGDPLEQSRGYSCAAVLKDSVYVIGGVKPGDDKKRESIVDTVCYFGIVYKVIQLCIIYWLIHFLFLSYNCLYFLSILQLQVERYKEGQGWQVTNLRAIGERCFFSAIVL